MDEPVEPVGGDRRCGKDRRAPYPRLGGLEVNTVLKLGAFLAFVTFVLVVVMAIQLDRKNDTLDRMEDNLEEVETAVATLNEVAADTQRIAQSFVRDPEDSAAQQEALQRVFAQITEIHAAIVGAGTGG